MKTLRTILIPVACFVVSWALFRFLAGHFVTPAPAPQVMPTAPTKTKRERVDTRKASVEKLAENVLRRPMNQWAALWDDFARDATVEQLQSMPVLKSLRRDRQRFEGDDLLQVLAQEDLAIRTGTTGTLSEESFSALAESDPQAAWDSIAKNNRHDFVTAALRTLAAKDPAEALRRYKAMQKPERTPLGDGSRAEARRAAVWHTPLGAIFGAWARRDPVAAAEAARKLAPEDRPEAASHIAMTWAFRDGPAAIRYLIDFDKSGESLAGRQIRLDVVLRASFRTHPAETSKLMRETPMLRKVLASPPNLYVAVGPWFDADPEGALAWLLEPASERRTDALQWVRPGRNVATMERIIRGLAEQDPESTLNLLVTLDRRHPELAMSLADDLGLPLRGNPTLERLRLHDHPAEACDRWLAALREHGDPAKALEALGWTIEMATELAARAARVFPEKARQLAKLVPASALDTTNLWRINNDEIPLYWPELKGALKDPSPKPAKPAVPLHLFRYDPAAAAKALLATSPDAAALKNAVEAWAPYDLPAASDWVSQLPEGPAREQAGQELSKFQATRDPEKLLEFLSSSPPSDQSSRLWECGLRHLFYTGGDWKSWLERVPEARRKEISHRLAGEAKLIALAKRSAGK